MGRNKKASYKPRAFESLGTYSVGAVSHPDTSANVYESMLRSESFTALSPRLQILYVFCKAQFFGKRKPERDFPDVPELQGDDMFYFSWETAKRYGYKDGSHSLFVRDMKALRDAGFIELVSCGKQTRSKSIYKFSAKWREERKD